MFSLAPPTRSRLKNFGDVHIAAWAGATLIFVCVLAFRMKFRTIIPVVVLIAYGCVSVAFSARSHGLIFIMTGFGLWYGSKDLETRIANSQPRQIAVGSMILAVTFLLVFQLFVYLGLAGLLGHGTKNQLRRARNPYNPVSVLVAGRGSIPIAIRAISDAPWVGHGSRAYKAKYSNAITRIRGIKVIPAHSCLLSAWVFAGILSVPFWASVLFIHGRLFVYSANFGHRQFILLSSFLLADGFWNILFSPLGYARFFMAAISSGLHHSVSTSDLESQIRNRFA